MSTTLNEQVTLQPYFTAELAYVLGYAYGDGYVIQGKKVTWRAEKGLSLSVAHAYPEIQQRLITALKKLFSVYPIVEQGDGACNNVKIYSRLIVEWLQENGLLKQKAEHIRVPEAIFRSPAEVVAAYIGGYFDADGSDRSHKGGYGIDSVCRKMLEDMQLLLLTYGIASHIHTQDRSLLAAGGIFTASLSQEHSSKNASVSSFLAARINKLLAIAAITSAIQWQRGKPSVFRVVTTRAFSTPPRSEYLIMH